MKVALYLTRLPLEQKVFLFREKLQEKPNSNIFNKKKNKSYDDIIPFFSKYCSKKLIFLLI